MIFQSNLECFETQIDGLNIVFTLVCFWSDGGVLMTVVREMEWRPIYKSLVKFDVNEAALRHGIILVNNEELFQVPVASLRSMSCGKNKAKRQRSFKGKILT